MSNHIVELNEKDILALRAVAYGANTNRKLVYGTFTVFTDEKTIKEQIDFVDAIETVYALLDRIVEVHEE